MNLADYAGPVDDPKLWSQEAEQAVLGSLLLENGALALAQPLHPREFFRFQHGRIYAAIRELVNVGEAADPVTVHEKLRALAEPVDYGGMPYLNSLTANVLSAANVAKYAGIVRQHAARRELLSALDTARTTALKSPVAADATDDVMRLLARVSERAGAPAPLFSVVDLHELGQAQPPQNWFWKGYMPAGHLTHFGGHGGAGKSTVGLMLAACISVGRECLGQPTTRARVAFFSAEDPRDLLLRRLDRISRSLGIDRQDLAEQLHIIDATEFDPVLFAERRVDGGGRAGMTTPTYDALARYIDENEIELVVVDNASDTYDGDEINRPMVRGFVRALVRLVRQRNGAVLLMAHVDKGTSRAGKTASSESYSGSTAWHNSARSRLFLLEKEPGSLELQHQKCNLGPKQQPLMLEWPTDGVPQVVSIATGGPMQTYLDGGDIRALLRLIGEFNGRGEIVSTSPTSPHNNAAKLFMNESTCPKRDKTEIFALLRDAERQGLAERIKYVGMDRKSRERWGLTPAGCQSAGWPAATAATAATSSL